MVRKGKRYRRLTQKEREGREVAGINHWGGFAGVYYKKKRELF